MWRMWRMVDPRKAIIMTGLMIAFISTSIHLIQVSGDRYNINSVKVTVANFVTYVVSEVRPLWPASHTLPKN